MWGHAYLHQGPNTKVDIHGCDSKTCNMHMNKGKRSWKEGYLLVMLLLLLLYTSLVSGCCFLHENIPHTRRAQALLPPDGTHMHYVQSSAHCNMYVSHHHVNIFKA